MPRFNAMLTSNFQRGSRSWQGAPGEVEAVCMAPEMPRKGGRRILALEGIGFIRGRRHRSVFWHPGKRRRLLFMEMIMCQLEMRSP